jgi:hypothetical protein
MRHPVEAWGEERICPITKKVFHSAWSDKEEGFFTKCDQCCPEGYKPLGQRLHELNERRKHD